MPATQLASDIDNRPIQALKPGPVQTISTSTTASASSEPFGSSTSVIRVIASTAAWIVIGPAPQTAAADVGTYMAADDAEWFRIDGDGRQVLAALAASAGGFVNITEMV